MSTIEKAPLRMMMSDLVAREYGARIEATGRASGRPIAILPFPSVHDLDFEAAYLSKHMFGDSNPSRLTPFAKATYDQLLAGTALKWLQIFPAGIDVLSVCKPLLQRGVRLTTSSGALGEPISVSAIGGLIAVARGFPRWIAAQHRKEWSPTPESEWPDDISGQTAIVVGMGPIGRGIARLGAALGLTIIAIRKDTTRLPADCAEVHGVGALLSLAPQANWIILACPLNDETRGCVSAAVLAALPKRAGIVNISRGALIDEPALIEGLQSGRLRGAYLDSFVQEPLPPTSPFWTLPNTIVSPHNCGVSVGNLERRMKIFFDNIGSYIGGTPMINEVRPPGSA